MSNIKLLTVLCEGTVDDGLLIVFLFFLILQLNLYIRLDFTFRKIRVRSIMNFKAAMKFKICFPKN